MTILIDGLSNESSLDSLFAAHDLYKIGEDTAYAIIMETVHNMKCWEALARDCGLSDKEMSLFSQRFEEGCSFS